MKKKILIGISIPLFSILYSSAFAHVTVKPTQVGIGSYQTFTISVPVEKNTPTVALKLIIPEGLENVTPNVKTGWKVTTKKTSADEGMKVIEIDWTNGNIPTGLRDEFSFSAKIPVDPGVLIWKAYQTYQDRSVVSWDVDPLLQAGMTMEPSNTGPYSTTKVIDDLSLNKNTFPFLNPSFEISILALIVALYALYLSRKRTDN